MGRPRLCGSRSVYPSRLRNVGRELTNAFRGFLRRHRVLVDEVAEFLLVQLCRYAVFGKCISDLFYSISWRRLNLFNRAC